MKKLRRICVIVSCADVFVGWAPCFCFLFIMVVCSSGCIEDGDSTSPTPPGTIGVSHNLSIYGPDSGLVGSSLYFTGSADVNVDNQTEEAIVINSSLTLSESTTNSKATDIAQGISVESKGESNELGNSSLPLSITFNEPGEYVIEMSLVITNQADGSEIESATVTKGVSISSL